MWKAGPSVLVVLAALSSGCGLVTRPVDVYYKAGFVLTNLGDPVRLPPHANLCMEQFCTRTDTQKKYVGGRKGYTSQVQYNYCPLHQPSFVATKSRLDGPLYFVYWGSAWLLSTIMLSMLFLGAAWAPVKLWSLARGDKSIDIVDGYRWARRNGRFRI